MKLSLGTSATLLLLAQCSGKLHAEEKEGYGVDVSFPVHHGISENYPGRKDGKDKDMPLQTLGNMKEKYDEFLQGCRDFYSDKPDRCDVTERERLAMSVRQPQSMFNYTETGFKKIRAPEAVMKLLTTHWNMNKDKKKLENWPAGNTYTNHWAAETYMVSVEDASLPGAGFHLKNAIWDAVKDEIERWTGMEQKPISQYGIRIYTEGSILSPHVDRLPLVSSCIINVAQDVEEDWPIEVYDRQGKAVNVTMQPGDMVLYESHSLIHGRPFPLKGSYFANIFIHFEPTGRSLRPDIEDYTDVDLPPYIVPGTPEEANFRRYHPNGWKMPSPSSAKKMPPEAHQAAQAGDVDQLERIAKEKRHLLHQADNNGWTPLHEAARAGHKAVVEKLIEYGADMNEKTNFGEGSTPLALAIEHHGDSHPLAQYLMQLGAVDAGPEL